LLSLGLARGVVLPYRNYFEGLAKDVLDERHIEGVITLEVLEKASELKQLPKEALDRLDVFLADGDAFTKMREEFLAKVNFYYQKTSDGLYLDSMERWSEINGTAAEPGQVDAVDAAGSTAGDPLVNFFDKSRGDSLTDSNDPGMRAKRIEDSVTTILRHRNLFNPEGDNGTYEQGWTISVDDIKKVLEQYSDKFTSEEIKALSKFSQSDLEYLMSLNPGDLSDLSDDEKTRALANGKLSIDWLEQWLFVNNEDPRSNQAGNEDYIKLAGEPAANAPDQSYRGTDVYDMW
jgi:hypothetical protein